MEAKELLKPRYKVIADYPESPYKIGDIEVDRGWSDTLHLKDFPAIFKPLAWWEERGEEDMPNYLRIISYNKPIVPAKKHFVGRHKNMFELPNNRGCVFYEVCEPATKEEYEEYKSNINKHESTV